MFSWKPIYAEIAKKLPDFQGSNEQLVSLIRKMHDQGLRAMSLSDLDIGDVEVEMSEMDPFSFFANFNRGVTDEKRRAILSYIKEEWNLASDLPQDFAGLPLMSTQSSWFMPYKKLREPQHVSLLWKFYIHCFHLHSSDGLDTRQFDDCCELRKVAPASLTMGMFWSRPDLWIAVDRKNRARAEALGVSRTVDTGTDYLQWLKEVREKTLESPCEFSHQAHLDSFEDGEGDGDGDPDMPSRNYWLLAPGQGAALWDAWFAAGIGAIGWNGMGDLSKYESKEAMEDVIPKVYEDSGPGSVARMMWEFSRDMKSGDVVFAKRGLHKICGWGLVAGDYKYDESQDPYFHLRRIDWKDNTEVKMPTGVQLPLKTITRMTAKAAFLRDMKKCYGDIPGLSGEVAPRSPKPPKTLPPTHPPYVKADAMADLFMTPDHVGTCIELLRRKKNIVLQGAPGTGKTFVAKRLAYLLMGQKDESRVQMVQFHQSLTYEDFVQGFKPNGDGGFKLENGVFHNFVDNALARPELPFVFIIDEINRGNMSKVFGELLMLIEPDKRSSDFALPLSYCSDLDATFYVPPNVHLIGTMNTADRSLSMVDYALRRRFAFVEVAPGFESPTFLEVLANAGASESLVTSIRSRMKTLNDMILADESNLGRGYRIGHSFFCPTDGEKADEAWMEQVIEYEIKPLLREYYCDDSTQLSKALDVLSGP